MGYKTVIAALMLAAMSWALAVPADADASAPSVTRDAAVVNAAPDNQEDTRGTSVGAARFDASIPDPGATAPRQNLPAADFEALTSPFDWGDDRPIATMSVMQGGRMSLDHAANGDLYCAQWSPNSAPQCSVMVYKSSNAGLNWVEWGWIRNAAGDDTLWDAVLRVGPGSNPWLFILCHYKTAAGALKLYRVRADSTGGAFYNIIRGDSVEGQIDLDRNVESPYALFMTYLENRGGSKMLRLFASYDSGATWTNGRSVRSGGQYTPRTCAGAGGYVYLTWSEEDSIVWVGRYTNNLVSPSMVFNNLDTSGYERGYVPSVAASRIGTGGSQRAWVLDRHLHRPQNAYDVHVSYSTDGGQNWTTAYWQPCGGIVHTPEDFRAPYVRCSYDYSVDLVSGVATLYTTPESLVHAWAPASNPNTWDRDIINEQRVTGQHSPGLDLSTLSGGAVVTWRQYGSGNLWADYWWNTGIEGGGPARPAFALEVTPNPARTRARISYSLPAAGAVNLTVHDVTGRTVATLASGTSAAGSHVATWDRGSAPAGFYVCRLNAGGRTASRRLVLTD